jgi:poly(3-hydroxybutyrate) depolymerase
MTYLPSFRIRFRLLSVLVAFAIFFGVNAPASTILKSGTFGGSKVEYKVVLPDGYDPARAYPVILAFGGGTQDMRMVDIGLKGYWAAEAERRGYIVVSPATPDNQLFFESSDRIFPEFLDMILRDYKVLGGRMHVGGPSNGGVAAFHVASLYPKYFWSVTVFPGYLNDTTEPVVDALKSMCIYMYVGDLDKDWMRAMKQQAEMFTQRGFAVQFLAEEDQHHALDLGQEGITQLFDDLDKASKGCSG